MKNWQRLGAVLRGIAYLAAWPYLAPNEKRSAPGASAGPDAGGRGSELGFKAVADTHEPRRSATDPNPTTSDRSGQSPSRGDEQ